MNKVIFLDRDGTIIKDKKYLSSLDGIEFLNDIDTALNIFLKNDFKLIVVSNQSGVGRGYMRIEDVEMIHDCIQKKLSSRAIPITAFYYCPHYVGSQIKRYNVKCSCRKPSAELISRAAKEHDVDLKESYMIGDKESDVLAGKNAGLKNSYRIDKKHNLLYYANLICNDMQLNEP